MSLLSEFDKLQSATKPKQGKTPKPAKSKLLAEFDSLNRPKEKGELIGGMRLVAAKSKGSVHFGSHDGPGVYDITEAEAKAKYGSMEKAAAKLSELGYVPRVRYKGQRNIYVNHIHLADPDKADDKEVNRLRSQKDGRPQKQDKAARLKQMQAAVPDEVAPSHSSKKAGGLTPTGKPKSAKYLKAEKALKQEAKHGKRIGALEGLGKKETLKQLGRGAKGAAQGLVKAATLNIARPDWGGDPISEQFANYGTLPLQIVAGGAAAKAIGGAVKAVPVLGKVAKGIEGANAAANATIKALPTAARVPAAFAKGAVEGNIAGTAFLAPGAIVHKDPIKEVFSPTNVALNTLIGGGAGVLGTEVSRSASQLKQLKSLDEALESQGHVAPEVKAEIAKLEQVAPKVEPVPTPEPVPTVKESLTVQPEPAVQQVVETPVVSETPVAPKVEPKVLPDVLVEPKPTTKPPVAPEPVTKPTTQQHPDFVGSEETLADLRTQLEAKKQLIVDIQSGKVVDTPSGDRDIGYRSRLEVAQVEAKGLGMKIAAEERKLTGNLTAKELANAEKLNATNYAGKRVLVTLADGTQSSGTATGQVAFGKPKVKLDSGEVKVFAPESVKPEPVVAPKAAVERRFYEPVDPVTFRGTLGKTSRPGYLSGYSDEELATFKLRKHPDYDVGYAVKPDGDIVNVFNNGGPKGMGRTAVIQAILDDGGTKLDCFDDYLPKLYKSLGFKEVGRVPWDDAYAPEGWDYNRHGRPDVVYLEHGGFGDETQLAESYRTQWGPGPKDGRETTELLADQYRRIVGGTRRGMVPGEPGTSTRLTGNDLRDVSVETTASQTIPATTTPDGTNTVAPAVTPKPKLPKTPKPTAPKPSQVKPPKNLTPAPKGELPDDVAEALSRIKQTVRGVAKSERGSFSLKDADDTARKQFMADVKTVGRHYYGQFAGDAEAWIAAMRESFEDTWDSVKPHISKMWAEIDRESQPITPKPKTVPVMEKGQTGASIERINANRADRGLAPVAKQEAQTVSELLDNGKRLVDDNAVNPNALASEIIDKPRPLTGDEVAALAYNRQKLNNELTVLRRQADDALSAGDSAKADSISTQIKKTERAFDDNDAALSYSGTENAQGMYARKVILREDYSMEGLLAQKRRSVNTGRDTVRDLTPEEKAELTALKEQYDAALQRSTEYEAQNSGLMGEIKELQRQLAETSRRPGKLPGKPRARGASNTVFTTERYEAAKARFADRYNNPQANVGLDPQMFADAVDIIGFHVETGVRSFAEIHRLAKRDMPGISDDDISKAYSKVTDDDRLAAIKERLEKELTETNRRLGMGEGPKPKAPKIMDDTEAMRLRAELEQARIKLKQSVTPQERITVSSITRRAVHEVGGGFKSLKASMDISAPMRQGRKFMLSESGSWLKAWVPQMKSFASEKQYLIHNERIKADEYYIRAKRSHLALSDIDAPIGTAGREEAFVGGVTDKLPGIRNSSRAYTSYLNDLRFNVFKKYMQYWDSMGINNPSKEKELANFINAMTDRGQLGRWELAAPDLNVLFFSPRRVMGQLQSPQYMLSRDPEIRKLAIKSHVAYLSGVASMLALAKMSGAKVEADPRSNEFAKIRIGNTRIDLTGGDATLTRYMAQFISRATSRDGKAKEMTTYQKKNLPVSFMRSKSSPMTGLIWNLWTGEDFTGKDVAKAYKDDTWKQLFNDMAPIVWTDIMEAYNEIGTAGAIGTSVLSGVGVGIQTYEYKPKKGNKPKGRTGPPSRPKPPTRPTQR